MLSLRTMIHYKRFQKFLFVDNWNALKKCGIIFEVSTQTKDLDDESGTKYYGIGYA